ncbi:MAG: biopolymer transport protein ExbB [Methylophagaceae bacterium]|jgi:biopolymer transport protein ExbB
MRLSYLMFLLSVVSNVVLANHLDEKPKDLDALFERVKHDRVMEQAQNKQREMTFIAQSEQQAVLLAQAKSRLAEQEAKTVELNNTFQVQEQLLAEQNAVLVLKSGSLGELFGTVRQVANESRSVLESSMISAELPDRGQFLGGIAERKQQPSIAEIRQVWLSLQQEMTESGKVKQFTQPIISAQGMMEEKLVTRIGPFSAFSEGQFLRYLPETGNLVALGRQPVDRLQQVAADFESADAGEFEPVVIDPTRGAIMALLVQAPDLKERIQQGGWIGYLILVLGAVGLLIAIQRFVSLTMTGQQVAKQQKQSTPDNKNPLGRILSACRPGLSNDIDTLTLKLDEAVLREVPRVERGLITLAILAAIAPMLGLLGTVSGMIETFQSITLFGTGDPKLMSGGISQALVTTELGLAVAIPLLLIHSLLSSKSNGLVQIFDEESAALIAHNAEKNDDSIKQ